MGTKSAVFFILAPFAMFAMANAQSIGEFVTPQPIKDVACSIQEIFDQHLAEAKRDSEKLNADKQNELADWQHREERSKNGLAKGENVTTEFDWTQHKTEIWYPEITVDTSLKSFDFVESYLAETKIVGVHECWASSTGLIKFKTKVPCIGATDGRATLPQFRRVRWSFSLPSTIHTKWTKKIIVFGSPNITERDNRADLDDAKEHFERINADLANGQTAIYNRHKAEAETEIAQKIEQAETDANRAIDDEAAKALQPIVAARADLEARKQAARAQAGNRAGEVDASFAVGFDALNASENTIRAAFAPAHADVAKQIAILRAALHDAKIEANACATKM